MHVHFNKEPVMNKKDNEDFEDSTNCWICDNDYFDNDIKLRDHCHITRKYRASAHRDCSINVKLNRKIPAVFDKIKNYDLNLNMQELGKLNLTKWIGKVILNGLEK